MAISDLLSKKKLVAFLDYFIVFIIIIYGGKASVFFQSLDSWVEPVGLLLPVLTFVLFAFVRNIHFNKRFWIVIVGFTLYFIASTIKFAELHPRFYMINLIYISMAYSVIAGLQKRYFNIFEVILYYLCIIAIILWIALNVTPEFTIEFLRIFSFSYQYPSPGNIDYNTIFYTVNNYDEIPQYILSFGGLNVLRNSGFAWEPGIFSVYINIAILFNLLINRFKIKGNIRLYIFILALATTFSTTGYMLLLLLIVFYIYNQKIFNVAWLIPVFVVVALYIFSLPFMAQKISELTSEYNTEELIYNSMKYDIKYQPQRFESFEIDFKDFLNHPVIGYGGHLEAKWTNQLGASIATVSGLGKILAQYGIVGFLFFMVSLWKASRRMILLFGLKGMMFPFAFVLFISISYSVVSVIIMVLWLLYLPDFYKSEIARRIFISKYLLEKEVKTVN